MTDNASVHLARIAGEVGARSATGEGAASKALTRCGIRRSDLSRIAGKVYSVEAA